MVERLDIPRWGHRYFIPEVIKTRALRGMDKLGRLELQGLPFSELEIEQLKSLVDQVVYFEHCPRH